MESNKVGQEKPKLILLTGPQGSGNHMWSKLFAMHPVVTGWVMQNYWEGHHEEPFAEYWDNPDKLKEFEIPENKKYFVTHCVKSLQFPTKRTFQTNIQNKQTREYCHHDSTEHRLNQHNTPYAILGKTATGGPGNGDATVSVVRANEAHLCPAHHIRFLRPVLFVCSFPVL